MTTTGITLAGLLFREKPATGIRADINEIARLQERAGRRSKWRTVEAWDDVPDETKKRVYAAFPDGPHELADLMTDGESPAVDLYFSRSVLKVKFNGHSDDLAKLNRTINMHDDFIHLTNFEVSHFAQGEGKGRRVLLGTYEVARRLDLKVMYLDAVDVGAYVWARAGFLPTASRWRDVAKTAMRRIGLIGGADEQTKADLQAICSKADPGAIWELADYEAADGRRWGSDLLLDNGWGGSLQMNCGACVKRLKEYCSGATR